MAHDEASARKKAIDFYEIEPAVLRVVAIKLDSAKAKPTILSPFSLVVGHRSPADNRHRTC
jgi:hypothetical protein